LRTQSGISGTDEIRRFACSAGRSGMWRVRCAEAIERDDNAMAAADLRGVLKHQHLGRSVDGLGW